MPESHLQQEGLQFTKTNHEICEDRRPGSRTKARVERAPLTAGPGTAPDLRAARTGIAEGCLPVSVVAKRPHRLQVDSWLLDQERG